MDYDQNQTLEKIDLFQLLHKFLPYLRRFWAFVLVLGMLGSGLMCLYTYLTYRPMYRSEAIFSVGINYDGITDVSTYSYSYDKAAAEQVAETFPYILKSDAMIQRICQELNTGYINGSISSSAIPGTNFFSLKVTGPSAEDAYNILQATIKQYPKINQHILGGTRLNMLQEPTVASAPYNSLGWKRSVIVGGAAGAVLGLGILGILSVLRRTVLSTNDVKKIINLSCLARVPDVKLKRRKSSPNMGMLISHQEIDSPFSESMRLLRLKLLRQLKAEDKVIMITSSLPSEGKSSISVNLALSLAKEKKKVLLVDADLRGPSIKKLLNLTEPSYGLEKYFRQGLENIRFLRYQDTGLYVFGGDGAIANPTPLLHQAKLQSLVEALRPKFDYVIFDTPPCAMMADASAFARYMDKVIYVIREDYASATQIHDGVQSLSLTGANLCGYVFSRATSGHSTSYGYGYGRYGYGRYGYGYGKKNTPAAEDRQTT